MQQIGDVDVALMGEVGHPSDEKGVDHASVLPFHQQRLDGALQLAAGGEARAGWGLGFAQDVPPVLMSVAK
jgi:hypothetical protein